MFINKIDTRVNKYKSCWAFQFENPRVNQMEKWRKICNYSEKKYWYLAD